jgi:hypothetical protein
MKQPCPRDCPDRVAGCGATCPKWRKYVAWRNAEYERRKRQYEYEECKSFVIERAMRRNRSRRK